MRKVLMALIAAMAFAAVAAGGAGGTHSDGTGPKQDLVAGTGRVNVSVLVPPEHPLVHVNATRDKEGEVEGHFFVRYPTSDPGGGFDMRGDVVCLTVVGNVAGLVNEIEQVKGTPPRPGLGFEEGNRFTMEIADNGEPGTLDRVNFSGGFDPGTQLPPSSCPGNPFGLPITEGNYIAHQDPPLGLFGVLDLLIAEFEAAAGEH
jgi:hypothetical protein